MSTAPTVMLVSAEDLSPRFAGTVLARLELNRVHVTDPAEAPSRARSEHPRLVIVDGRDAAVTGVLKRIREDPETRRVSMAAVIDHPSLPDETRLREAGANVVLAGEAIPFLWDRWIQELMSVPPRRAVRVPVRLEVWQRRLGHPGPRIGWTVNLSTRGMLLETPEPVEIGTTLDMQFRLGNDDSAVHAVSQVVRMASPAGSATHSGVKFLRLSDADHARIEAFAGLREH